MTQPEARLQRRIQHALKASGAFSFKVHGSEFMMAGLPDLVVCLDGMFLGIEVKMPGCVPTERQLYVHDCIRAGGGHVLVADSVSAVRAWVLCLRTSPTDRVFMHGTCTVCDLPTGTHTWA